jgi:hypothetical protein
VPRATRTYLVEQVLCPSITSVKVDILAKYVGFFKNLRKSPSPEVSFMAHLVGRDMRTVTGRNLRLVKDETGLCPWLESSVKVKSVLAKVKVEIPPGDHWRLGYLGLLLEQRQSAHYMGCMEEEERTNELIESLCIN